MLRAYWTTVAGAVALAVGGCTPPAPVGGYVSHGRVLTAAESTYGAWISRDCGFSRSATDGGSGQQSSFWVFCDTTMNSQGFNTRGSAAEATAFTAGALPNLGDHPAPGAAFLPDPGGVCWDGTRPALWTQGLSPAHDGTFRVYYSSECSGERTLSWGSVLWNPFTKAFSDNQRTVFTYDPATTDLAPEKELNTPIERGSYTYFSARLSANRRGVTIARVPTASVNNPTQYQWFTGTANGQPTWGSVAKAQAAPTLASGFTTMDYFPSFNTYVAIVQSGGFGHPDNGTTEVKIYESQTPENPASWRLRHTVKTPGECLEGKWCYAFIGHPELSTNTQLMISHYNHDDRAAGQAFGHTSAGMVGW